MSDTTEQESARDAALAGTLSAMAETAPVRRRRRWRWRGIVAILGVFALAGAGTGALTAGALVRSAWTPPDSLLQEQLANFAAGSTGYAKPAGTAAFRHAPGRIDLHLGDGPASGPAAIEVWCLGAGSATWKLGDTTGTAHCSRAEETPRSQNLAVGTWAHAHLTGTLDGDVAIWAGQLRVAPQAAPSGAQQNAVADGVVTRDEYLQAWARMAGCMDADGYDYSPSEPDRILLSTGVDGAHAQKFDLECYPREFQDVDTLWQSQMDVAVAACLAAHGVAGTDEDLDSRLLQAHLTPESCHLW